MDKNSEKLRAQAREELRQGKRFDTSLYETDLKVLVEELSIFQIELENQNQELIQSQNNLQQSNDRYLDLFDNAPIGYLIVDMYGVIKDINQTACSMLERGKNEFTDTKITKFIHPDYQDIYYQYFQALTRQRYHQPCDIKLRKANNQSFYARIQGVCQTRQIEHEPEYRLAISDISIQKEMEIKLLAANALTKQSEERFEMLFNQAPLGYQSLDFDGNFIEVNQQWLDMLGFTRAEVIGKWFGNFLTPAYQNGFRERFPIIKSQGYIHSEFEMVHKNGSTLFIAFEGKIGYDTSGEFKQTHCILQDITLKRQAENELKESEENLSITLHSIGDGVISTNINGLIVNMNPVAEKLCGWELIDAMGKPLTEVFKIFNAETRQSVADPVEKVLKLGEIVGLANHTVLISKNGSEYQIADSAAPIKNKEGAITGVVLVFSDVTEKYAAELALKESEERFKALHNASFGGISIHDKGKILECNQGLVEMTGYSMDELIGMDGLLLIAPEHRERVLSNISSGYEKPYEANGLRKNGEIYPMRLEARNVPYKGKNVRTVEFRDITENKQAEASIKKTKEKIAEERKMLRILIDNLPDHIYIKDLEGRKVISNIADFKDLGLESEEQILGKTDLELFPGDTGQRGYADDMEVITTGKAIMWQEEYFVNSSGTRRWSLTTKIPLYDSAGKIIGLVGIGHDITKRKKTEEELMEAKEKAQESDRLKSAFLANMSHEIRTPMNGILGFAELLKEPDLSGEQQHEYIKIIEKSGARMLNIINDIVDISKIEAGLMKLDIKESNINEQIEYIYTFFKPEVEAKGMKLSFNTALPAKEAIIKTDREKVYAILMNLVKNAIKFTNNGPIEFGYDVVEKHLQFYVKDTGIGIPKERQEAIFERFIQADIADKMAHQGAGLGLSITKAYVEMLGGKIWVESEVGIGSTFYFTLPYHAETVQETIDLQSAPTDKNETVRKLKILIAEDDEVSEMLMTINMNEFGTEILNARTGTEAIEVCKKNPDIDLVLMDIRMPEMGGYEATQQIRLFNKSVIIIAQTAYGLSGDHEKALEAGCNDYIAKPIKKEELLALIQKYFGK